MSRVDFVCYFDKWAESNFSEIVANDKQGGIFKNSHLNWCLVGSILIRGIDFKAEKKFQEVAILMDT